MSGFIGAAFGVCILLDWAFELSGLATGRFLIRGFGVCLTRVLRGGGVFFSWGFSEARLFYVDAWAPLLQGSMVHQMHLVLVLQEVVGLLSPLSSLGQAILGGLCRSQKQYQNLSDRSLGKPLVASGNPGQGQFACLVFL